MDLFGLLDDTQDASVIQDALEYAYLGGPSRTPKEQVHKALEYLYEKYGHKFVFYVWGPEGPEREISESLGIYKE